MKNDFIKNINGLITQYNKKNKVKLEPIEDIEVFCKNVTDCVYLDLNAQSVWLHQDILTVVEGYIDIAKKRKLKDKHLASVVNAYTDLVEWLSYNQETLVEAKGNLDISFMEQRPAVMWAINKYIELLISKTVDYIPNDGVSRKQFEHTLDLFDTLKHRLYQLAEDESTRWWVYLYTEINWMQPFTLSYLDYFNKLGERIENAIDFAHQNKVVKMCEERGYDVFAGWGLPVNDLVINETKLSRKTPTVGKPKPSLKDQRIVVKEMWEHSGMFFTNPKFDINVPEHRSLYWRSMACCMMLDKDYDDELSLELVENLRNEMKRYPGLRKLYQQSRTGNKPGWFIDSDAKLLLKHGKDAITERWKHYATLVSVKLFDYLTADMSDPDEVFGKMHQYLARSHNVVFYNPNPFTPDELTGILTWFQSYLKPRFEALTPESTRWGYKTGMEFFLNIRDEERAVDAYNIMKEHFSARNSQKLNDDFYGVNRWLLLFMSYHNKKILKDKLDNEPFEIVSYGGSKLIYEMLYDIIKTDVDDPDVTFRYREVVIDEGGIKVDESSLEVNQPTE